MARGEKRYPAHMLRRQPLQHKRASARSCDHFGIFGRSFRTSRTSRSGSTASPSASMKIVPMLGCRLLRAEAKSSSGEIPTAPRVPHSSGPVPGKTGEGQPHCRLIRRTFCMPGSPRADTSRRKPIEQNLPNKPKRASGRRTHSEWTRPSRPGGVLSCRRTVPRYVILRHTIPAALR